MTALMYVIISTTVIIFGRSYQVINPYSEHISAIKEVWSLHKSPVVYFAHSSSFKQDLKVTTIFQSWTLLLSQEGVATQDISFSKLRTMSSIYHRRVIQPVFIVLLLGDRSILEFADIMHNLEDINSCIWFLVFITNPVRIDGNRTMGIDYCHKPPGNLFNINISTKMVVVCLGDRVVREWYAIDRNHIEMTDIAIWDVGHGMVKLTDKSIHERKNSLSGITLRVVTVKGNPFMDVQNETLIGFFGEILEELCRAANFTVKVVKELVEYGSWNPANNTWSGAIGEISAGRADIGVSDFTVTSKRLSAVDFSIPLTCTSVYVFLKDPGNFNIQWSAYFKTFSFKIWLIIISILLISPCILSLMMRHRSCNLPRIILDNYMNVWALFCQQGLPAFSPNKLPIRLAYFSLSLSALVVSAAYSATLICFLTSNIRTPLFQTLDEFLDDGSYKLLVVQGSVDYDMFIFSNESFARRARDLMDLDNLPTDFQTGYNQICMKEKYAMYASGISVRHRGIRIPCKIISIPVRRVDSLSMIFTKHSPLTALLNRHLQKFVVNGMVQRLKQRTFRYDEYYAYDNHMPVSLWSVCTVIAILVGGIILSLILLIIEYCFYLHYFKVREN